MFGVFILRWRVAVPPFVHIYNPLQRMHRIVNKIVASINSLLLFLSNPLTAVITHPPPITTINSSFIFSSSGDLQLY